MVAKLNIHEGLLRREPKDRRGFSSFVVFNSGIADVLYRRYGRKGLCLKVFKRKRGKVQPLDLDSFVWAPEQKCLLVDCVKVQNIYAWHKLAPQVYDIVLVNGKRFALVTDYMADRPRQIHQARYKKCLELAGQLGLDPGAYKTFKHEPNWQGGKFVDFGSCCLQGDSYLHDLKQRIINSNGKRKVYQPVPELGITDGRRDMVARFQKMRLLEQNFRGKNVLDLGCSVGGVCRKVASLGARRVVGIDSAQAQLAHEIANWTAHYNLDFINLTLPISRARLEQLTGLRQFDVVFALAILKWTGGYRPWLASIVKRGGTLYLESHDAKAEELPMDRLNRDFKAVTFMGYTRDLGRRKLYRCEK